jgi:hypothetical protein
VIRYGEAPTMNEPTTQENSMPTKSVSVSVHVTRHWFSHSAPLLVLLLGVKNLVLHLAVGCHCTAADTATSTAMNTTVLVDFFATLLITVLAVVAVLRHRKAASCPRCLAARQADPLANRPRHRAALWFHRHRSVLLGLGVLALAAKTVFTMPQLPSQALLFVAFACGAAVLRGILAHATFRRPSTSDILAA